jgi:hypothetical protein
MNRLQEQFSALRQLSPSTIVEMLSGLDDRPTAIVATSLLENILGIAIAYKFGHFPSDAEFGNLFTGYGPLATFSARIAISYNLKVTNTDQRHDLTIIKDIRNKFAHNYLPLSFASNEIKTLCLKLKLTTVLKPPISDLIDDSNRGKFIKSVIKNNIFLITTMIQTKHEKDILKDHKQQIYDKTLKALKDGDYSL